VTFHEIIDIRLNGSVYGFKYLAFLGFSVFCDFLFQKNGRRGRIRTYDPLLPKQMRYQAALRADLEQSV
jgi:hypothetical protein